MSSLHPSSSKRQPQRRPAPARLRPVALAAASALGLLGAPLQAAGPAPTALPSGLSVVQGSAQVATVLKGTAAQMTVRNSAGAILNWDSFSIGAQAGVHFQQADAASKVLNRVTGSDPSSIFGSLTSNGQVWLLNPNGVLFGASARVDVAGLVASTLRLDDNAFLDGLRSGRFSFADGAAGATVRNEGALRTAHGGHLLLLAERVENAGTLDAPSGALLMAGAKSATLVDSALPYLAAVVPADEVLNLGRAAADGGVVDVYASVVNQQGLVRADTVALDAQGRVVLKAADTLMLADGSTTQAAGTSAGQSGGRVDLLGARVGLVGTATVDVSGDTAGGAVRVGGGLQGQDRTVDNAQAVYIGPEARLRADATGASNGIGTGGSLIVWSDTATRAWGHFSARGGLAGGDGGFIETSGGWIDARPASIDVTSRGGRAGTWLIDPNNLTISNTGPDTAVTGGPSFTTTGDGAVISTATIAAALNAGSSVTLTTAAAGASTEAGDILMLGATLTVAPTAPVTLTLNATRDIVVQNSSITSTGSPLSLDFRAAGGVSGVGVGVIDIYNSLINTAGGNVSLGGQNILTLPLPGGDTLPGTFRPAVSYLAASGPPSLSRSGGATAINIEASTLELGGGNLFAVGFSTIDNRDAVVVGSLADAGTIVRGASLELVGVSFVPTPVDFDAGLAFVGNATDVVASQSIDLTGAGRVGVVIEGGARLTLNGTVGAGAGVALRGWGRDEAGAALVAGDDSRPVGRGARLTVTNGSLLIQGSATDVGVAGVALYNFDGSPGPILNLAAATSATLETLSSGPYAATGLSIGPVDITPPTAATLTLRAPGELSINELFVTGTAGALVLEGQRIAIDNSVFSSTAAPLSLSFVSAGTNALGVSLNNTIIETRGGNVTFGDLRLVSSPILGATTVAANWIETDSSDTSAALSITDSVIDAGSGRIVGGGAVAEGGFSAVGLNVFRSVLTASSIQLAGRSDYQQGLVLAESTLNATSVLSLAGDSASNFPPAAFGLQIGQRSTLQLIDPTAAASSSFSLRGRQLTDGIGLLIEGGAVGSGNETRLAIEGAAATLSGTSGSGSGLVLRGSAAASGGVFINAAAAPSLRLEGLVTLDAATGGTGTGLQLFHARVIGPQLATSSPLDIVANGGGAVGAGLRLEFSSLSSGGVTTVAGNSILVSNSLLSGDGSINFFAVDQGASAGSVVIDQSLVQTSSPTARVFAGTRAGGPAIGVAGIAGGAGVLLTDSELEATEGGGTVELRGTGAATGGRGIEFARTPLTANTLTLVGRGSFDGEGVFSDDLGTTLSTLMATTLLIDGVSANDPAATVLTRAGIVLGRGVEIDLRSGGSATITGDLVSLGRNANMTTTGGTSFEAFGAPANFSVLATRSILLREATLDFSTGSGTAVTLRGDTDALEGGSLNLQLGATIRTGGGDVNLEGRGSLAALTALSIPRAGFLFETGTGVSLLGTGVLAGAGVVSIVGRAVDTSLVSGAAPRFGGVALGAGSAGNTVSGRRVVIEGIGVGPGVVVGFAGLSGTHRITADEILVVGTGVGTNPSTGRREAGFEGLPNSILTATTSLDVRTLDGSGALTAGSQLISLGSVSIDSTGPVRLSGNVSAAGALLVSGLGVPGVGAVPPEPGVLVGVATYRGGAVTINGSQPDGSAAIQLLAPVGSGLLQATAGDLGISAGTNPANGFVEINGGWTLSATGDLRIVTPQRLALASGATSGLSPVFDAANVTLRIAAAGSLSFGNGVGDLDLSLLGTAVAGLAPGSVVTIRALDGRAVTVEGNLSVPGRLRLLADDVTLASDSSLTAAASGDAILIGGETGLGMTAFFNDAGGGSLVTPAGRWVILATNSASTTLGGLDPAFLAYGLGTAPWGVDGSGDLITPAPGNALGFALTTAAVSGAALSVSQARAYDTTASITLNPGTWTVGGLVAGDTLSLAGSTAATMADKNVGVDKPVTPDAAAVFSITDADGRPVFGYGAPALRATITPVALTASGTVVANKVYDGGVGLTIASLGSVTPLAGDAVSIDAASVTAAFSDRNAGTAKPVLFTGFALTGADAGNYTVALPTGVVADITPRGLGVTGLAAASKVYDSTTLATLTGSATIAPLGGDIVTLAGTASAAFADKNVGTAKVVTVSGYTLTGADAGNYVIVTPALSADITPATLAVTGLVAASRVYDATTAATVSGTAVLAPALGTDVVTLAGTASGSFADKSVGTAKAVTLGGLSLAGADAGNYLIATPGLSADITPATLAVTGLVALPRVYDATTVAPLSGSATVVPLGTDIVTLAGTAAGAFADKNVGTAKAVTVSGLTLAGADAGNYAIALPTGLSADVTTRTLAVTGVAAAGKVYDSTTAATLTGTATIAPLGGDVVTLAGAGSGSFADKNVGAAKAVTVGGYTLAGTDATNYAIVQPAGLSADITPATLAVTGLVAASRVYDATTAASVTGTPALAPALGADVVTLAGTASGSFADKNVGTAKAVTLGGLSLAGADAGNYLIATPGLSADITPATLAVTGLVALPRVYDATTVAPLSGSPTVVPLGADVVSLAGTAAGAFADKNVGTAKAVTVSGLTLAGADAGNYAIALPTGLSADVTTRTLAVTGVAAAGKVYDSTTTATLTGTATIAPLGGDVVTLSGAGSAAFANKNVGTAKAVTVSGYTLAGTDATNYAIVQPAGLSADITAAPLAVTGLAAVSRVYDRSTVAALSGTAAVSPLGGDVVTLAGTATGAFATAGVGTGKAVSVAGLSLAGADAGNYSIVLPAGLTADVTPRTLSLAGLAAASRVYDAGTTAAVSGSLAGVLSGDVVSVSLGGAFADANVGSAKPVTVSATLAGADATNYTLAAPTGLSASITPATLRYVAVPAFGTAGQPLPALTGNVSGFLGTDTLATATTGTLTWTTPAGAASPAGLYAINGGGLSALNYAFVQDATNATALTLRAAAVSDPVTTATTVVTTTALFSVSVPLLMSTPTEGRTLDVTPAFAVSVGAEAERRARVASAAGGDGAGRPAPGVAGGTAAVTAPGPAPDGSTAAPAPGAVAPGTAAAAAALPSLSAAVSAASAEAAGGLSYAPLDFSRLPRDEVQTLLAARARYKQQIFADGIHRLQQDPTLADVRACRNEAELDSGQCLITEDLKRQIQAARDEARRRAEAAAAAAAAVPGAAATPQAARLQRRVVQAALPVIERKLALLIGVNDYRDKAVPQLAGAVRDARAVRERLEQRLGYETTVLESPGRDDIVRAFNRLALEARPGDSVIVYYAGHGVVVPVNGVDTGFWLPADVDSRKEGTWLSNADIARLIAAIGSRQLMLVSDSCYSGTLVGKERSSVSGDNPDEMLKRRAAVVMSSGGDEPVADEGKDGHSFFAWHFMRALEGLDRWQAGNSVYDRLRGAVSREFPQTPQYGGSRGLGHEGGTDYLFERRQIEAGAKAP